MSVVRLLFCNHQSHPHFVGGAELILLEIARYVDRAKFDVLMLANHDGAFNDMASKSGIPVRVVRHDMLWDFLSPGRNIESEFQAFKKAQRPAIENIKSLIRSQDIDAVVAGCIVNIAPLIAAKECGVPAIWLINEIVYGFDGVETGLRKIRRLRPGFQRQKRLHLDFLRNIILEHSTVSVFITETSRAKMFRSEEWRHKAVVLYPPVRRDVFCAPLRSGDSFPGIPDNAFCIVFMGILIPHKGVHDLIRAAAGATRVRPNLHFAIAGGSPNTKYVSKLRDAVRRKNLENKILFTGFLENPLHLIDRSDVICMPSLYEEPFGMVVSEGMARKKTVLAYETGSIHEVIENGINGFIVPKGDTSALARRILELSNQPSVLEIVGENARRTAEQRFHPELYIMNIENTLKRMLG